MLNDFLYINFCFKLGYVTGNGSDTSLNDDLTRDEDLSDETTKSPEADCFLSSASPDRGHHQTVLQQHQQQQHQHQQQHQLGGPSLHLQAQDLYHHHHHQYTGIKQEPYGAGNSNNSCAAAGLVHS
jgi:hypothetical protein